MNDKPTEVLRFDQEDIQNVLARMSPAEVDQLTFGAIQLDRLGVVTRFNAAEAALASRRVEDVLGRNFFEEVAPCTRRPEFEGKFREIAAGRSQGALFEYVFDYKMSPTKVIVHMKPSLDGEGVWVLVRRRG